nr:MAG: hypothetical protein [Bacteriophage sp.]
MFDDLEHYLVTICSQQRVDTIIRLLEALGGMVGVEHVLPMSQFSIGLPDGIDTAESISRLDDSLVEISQACFSELGIVLNEDNIDSTSFIAIEKMVHALTHAPSWEDPERLLGFLTASDDREMGLAEVIGEINSDDAGQYALLLESVSLPFYNNLIEAIEVSLEAMVAKDPDNLKAPPDRMRAFFSPLPDEQFVKRSILDGSFAFNLSLEVYEGLYANVLYGLEPTAVPDALLSLAVCSDLKDTQLFPEVIAALDKYIETPEIGIAMKHRIGELKARYPEWNNNEKA